jgi:PrtD family type I secretion system ABC transporter
VGVKSMRTSPWAGAAANLAASGAPGLRANPLRQALGRMRGILLSAGIFSGALNVLALAGSFYMLQIYDRILPSQSMPTLVAITALLAGLFIAYGILDAVRLRLMARVGARIDEAISPTIFAALPRLKVMARGQAANAEPLRDLDQIRGFLSGLGPTAIFDLPWIPVFLLVVFLLHPVLGAFALAGALILVGVTLLTELRTRGSIRHSAGSEYDRRALALAAQQHGEAVVAMGLNANLAKSWAALNARHTQHQLTASDGIGSMGALTRVLRLSIQSGLLGLGAYLVILGEVSAGTIIAASITMSRALAPVETAIAHWQAFLSARQSHARLIALFDGIGSEDLGAGDGLFTPHRSLSVENLILGPPGSKRPTLHGVSFDLSAGDGLGIVGPSACGKSTLARGLVGYWPSLGPADPIRLDGAALRQWSDAERGKHIGYLPQEPALFDMSVAETIARCDRDADLEVVIAAAVEAGCHEMILRLSDGYRTRVGPGGSALSAGQRQRIALARALFGKPFLVVLDEPNANLDAEGERALTRAIGSVRARGGIVIVIAHRMAALSAVDKVLALADGRMRAFGSKEDVFDAVLATQEEVPAPAKSAARKGGGPKGVIATAAMSEPAPVGAGAKARPQPVAKIIRRSHQPAKPSSASPSELVE